MAKSQYDLKVVPNMELIQKWARCGVSNEEIRKNLGIGKTTWYKYVNEHIELSELLKKTREIVDAEVENALLKKALGFRVTVKKTFKVKNIEYNKQGKKIKEEEELKTVDDELYFPPDLGAQCFWLKNRNPEEWRDKRAEVVEEGEEEAVIQLTKVEEEEEDESESDMETSTETS